jgi:hypothetical protein
MKNSKEFINSITNGENLEAEMHFSNSMTDKVGAALELRRIELANDSVNEDLGREVRDAALMRKAGQGDKNKEAKLTKRTTKLIKDVGTGLGQGMHSAMGAARRKAPALYKKAMSNPKTKKYMSDLEQKHGQRELNIGSKSIAKHRDKDNAPDKVKRKPPEQEFGGNDGE